MSKGGIDPKDLRPFSVEDPLGDRHARTVAAERRSAAIPPRAQTSTVRGAQSSPRQKHVASSSASRRGVGPSAPHPYASGAKKGKGCGCGTLFLFGCLLPVLIGVGITVASVGAMIPVFLEVFENSTFEKAAGTRGNATLLRLEPTDMSFNGQSFWELTLKIEAEDGPLFERTTTRQLRPLVVRALRETRSAGVLFDPDGKALVLLTVGGVEINDPRFDDWVTSGDAAALRPPRDSYGEAPAGLGGRSAGLGGAAASQEATDSQINTSDPSPEDDAQVPPSAPTEAHHPDCAKALACCLIVQAGRNEQGCETYKSPQNDEVCIQALPLYRKVGARIGRPCE